MKTMRHVLLCVAVCAATVVPAIADSSDEQAIRNVFTEFSNSWNQPGMPGFGDLFTEDADFVVISGKWLKGRDEIVSYHRDLLRGRYRDSHNFIVSVTVRILQPGIAIAHMAGGATYLMDGKEVRRTGLGTATLVKTDRGWRIAAFHNTLTSGPGYAFPPSSSAQPEKSPAASDHHLVECPDSPTPGKRAVGMDCAIVAHTSFNVLPTGPLVLRVENFPNRDEAQTSAAATGAVVEAGGRVWLLTLGVQGERSKGATFVSEIGPLPAIPLASSYELQVADADFSPAMNPAISKAIHTHSGPEIWYLLTGEQCLETPDGFHRAKAGQGMVAPADTPMQLNITGTEKREALFAIIHDAARPATTISGWQPQGTCVK